MIISFVFVLIGAYIYNILGTNGRGIILNLSEENGLTAIDSINPMKLAIAFAIISGILSLIFAIIMVFSGAAITTATITAKICSFPLIFLTILETILLYPFIEAYLIAVFYNFLAPKLGKLKIELVDLIIN